MHRPSVVSLLQAMMFDNTGSSAEEFCRPWVIPAEHQCQYVLDHISVCGEDVGLVPYLQLHYCSLGFSSLLSHILLLTWVFLLFVVLLVVTDHFFCPALEVIADYLKLPSNVAGATLLAFGNGSPDFFTQLAAISSIDAASVPIAIGEPIGGGLFVSNVVLAVVIFMGGHGSSGLPVERRAFLRDAGFYCGAMLLVALVLHDAVVNLREALLMVSYYACFVAYIIVFDTKSAPPTGSPGSPSRLFTHAARPLLEDVDAYNTPKKQRGHGSEPHSKEAVTLPSEAARSHAGPVSSPVAIPLSPRQLHSPAVASEPQLSVASARTISGDIARGERSGATCSHTLRSSTLPEDVGEPLLPEEKLPMAPLSPGATPSELLGIGHHLPAPPSFSWFNLFRIPITYIIKLTMPEVGTSDEVTYSRACAVVLPVAAPLFVVYVSKLAFVAEAPLGVGALVYGGGISLMGSLLVAGAYPAGGRPRGLLKGVLTVMAFCMSVLWMKVASAEMVRTWKVLGYIHGASQAMLGVTVLAWVNSTCDFIANTTRASKGMSSMAVAACFASPLFTLIGGLGITFLMAVAMHGPVQFAPGVALKVAWGFAAASIVRHVLLVPLLHGWRLTRSAAIGMLAFYAVFQLVYLALIAGGGPE